MITAVFFDLYGTLAGFSPSRYEIQSEACADFGIEVTPEGITAGYALADEFMARQNALDPVRRMDYAARERFFAEYERRILSGAGADVDLEKAALIWRRVGTIPYRMARFDDVLPTVDILKQQGLTLGLISNMNRPGPELMESMGLTPYLDFAVTSLEVGAEKPHAPIFRAALARAGVEPGEAVHVGDQLSSDVQGAQASGIGAVLLDRDRNHPQYDGCPRIETLMELPPLLPSLS